nr:DUF4276 family protein [Corallococcus coralloides]
MVKEIRLYIEGGGTSADGKALLRHGFRQFFDASVALGQKSRVRWAFVMCGSRGEAFHAFRHALKNHSSAVNILLVDSEGPVTGTPWEHLANRDPSWRRPREASADSCHLMVQTVEAWLMADPKALQDFYGQGFSLASLPKTANVERIAKDTLEASLKKATQGTRKGEYHKVRHCSELLKQVDPARVRARSAHCERLFTVLEGLLS